MKPNQIISRAFFLTLIIFSSILLSQSIKINEFLASNITTNPEMIDFDDYSDWIELYNSNSEGAYLVDYFLTDDFNIPLKWKIPDNTYIEADSFLIIWADSYNEEPNQIFTRPYWPWDDYLTKNYHTNFKLNKEGESIGLYRASPIDSIYFISQGSLWHYKDDGLIPDPLWKEIEFSENSWFSGYAELGYGDDDEATTVSYGDDSDEKYITTYFRKEFFVENILGVESLVLKVLRDDGVVVYLNGEELIRDNMPSGDIYHDTEASSSISFSNEEEFIVWTLPASQIVVGENLLAVEIHQISETSSDISFDLELIGVSYDNIVLIDSVSYGSQTSDISYGRDIESDNWGYYGEPTPGYKNTSTQLATTVFSGDVINNTESGFYNTPITVDLLSSNDFGVIHYTLDGSKPGSGSMTYDGPININQNSVLKSRLIETDKIPGRVTTNTYFISESNNLSTVSLIIDPDLLWNSNIGIYENEYKQREIPVTIQYFDNIGNNMFNINAGARLGGLNIWTKPQKPFTIYSRDRFGDDYINYQIFDNKSIANFSRIVLRNGGDDWEETLIRDPMIEGIAEGMMKCGYMAYKPSSLFLNGEYWGIYNIREKFNKNYFTQNFNVDGNDIDHLEYTQIESGVDLMVIEGDLFNYNTLIQFISNQNINDLNTYTILESLMDVDSFIDHIFMTIYAANTSWEHNREWWRPRDESGRWQWLIVDLDRGFNMSNSTRNLVDDLLDEYELFKLLMSSQFFQNRFIQRSSAHINNTFHPLRIESIVDSLSNMIQGEIYRHIDKWSDVGGIESFSDWIDELNQIKQFSIVRGDEVYDQLVDELDLDGTINIETNITPHNSGDILFNGVIQFDDSFTSKYIKNTPLIIKAIAKPGYEFVAWENISDSSSISINCENDYNLTAVFQLSNDVVLSSVIDQSTTLISSQNYVVENDLIISNNGRLIVPEGVTIKMPRNGNIIVNGSLHINGSVNSPVKVFSNENIGENRWGAICFNNESDTSKIDYLEISGASVGEDPMIHHGAISGNNANIIIKNTKIEDVLFPIFVQGGSVELVQSSISCNYTCDFINVKNGKAIIKDNLFFGSDAVDTDAIDLDNVINGLIEGNKIYDFNGYNSDGIDIGEASNGIAIHQNLIYNSGDKGVSVGQQSNVSLYKNVIIGGKIGIAVKDNSHANVINNTFFNNDTSISAFEKNENSGGGVIDVVNTIMNQRAGSPIYQDDISSITVNYSMSNNGILNGESNFISDPIFIDPEIYNLQISSQSPCINSGDPLIALDDDGTISDIGSYYLYNEDDYPFAIQSDLADQILLNELLAVNNSINQDEYGDFDDWVELYNPTNDIIDLSGCFLSDEIDNLSKWQFPDSLSLIPANGFLLVWCDNEISQGSLHTNFRLSSSGEILSLTKSNGSTLIDQIIFGQQTEDISYARIHNESNEWIYSSPSPLSQNQIMNIHQDIEVVKDFSLSQNYPNPFNPITSIYYTIPKNGFVNISVYDITGRKVKSLVNKVQYSGENSVNWNGTNSLGETVAGGMYFYSIQIENFKDTKKMLFIK